jgi:hypothetical protein
MGSATVSGETDMSNSEAVVVEPRVNRRQVLLGAGAAAGAAAMGLATTVVTASADSEDGNWILGAWDINVTPDANQGPPFTGVVGFAQGGVISVADANTPSPSVGGWKSGDDGKVIATFRNFSFAPDQTPQGMTTINVTLHAANGGKGFTGMYKVTAVDTTGTTVFNGSGHVDGTRLAVHGA